ncbi:hypothetical protein ACIQRS_21815 [Streptomyces termitum]|uniref:Uncharacterized protein n=1 Tax=Streptomyces termitum TaxID=67368 RepID=A0A918T4L6_9ACTN|nr:hypothetical protein [Streptomyces termitum]GHA92307.1 hypothetical protein GCM10010305_40030 [Streptomyces termitum]
MSSSGTLAGLRVCAAELSTPARVFAMAGRFGEPDPDLPELAARIRELLAGAAADEAWRRFLPGYVPPPVPAVLAALEPVGPAGAAALLAELAGADLLWPDHRHLPAATARRAADRVVSLLGPDGSWWTNRDAACGAVNGLTPVLDTLLAGTDGTRFFLLLQLADD